MGKKVLVPNSDFDEIFIFHKEDVKSFREQYKRLFRNIYLRKDVNSSKRFMDGVKQKLIEKKSKKTRWPYTQSLMLAFGVQGSQKIYSSKDIDNMLKSILDAFQGIVFVNDNQIKMVIATKQTWTQNIKGGFMVGIRILDDKVVDKYHPYFYSIEDTDEPEGNVLLEIPIFETKDGHEIFTFY